MPGSPDSSTTWRAPVAARRVALAQPLERLVAADERAALELGGQRAGQRDAARRGTGVSANVQPGALSPAASRLTPRASDGRSTAASAARARSPADA